MVVVSCLVGLLANRMGPGLPILTAYTPVAQVFIQLPVARSLLDVKQVIFVDLRARPSGSIPGAIRLSGVATAEVIERLKASASVICYGDDENDSEAAERALGLRRLGVSRVVFLAEGWRGWTSAGYPVAP